MRISKWSCVWWKKIKLNNFIGKGHYGIALCRQNCDIRPHGIPALPPTCWAVDQALLDHRPDYADLQPETTRSGFSFGPFAFHEPGAMRKCEFVCLCIKGLPVSGREFNRFREKGYSRGVGSKREGWN